MVRTGSDVEPDVDVFVLDLFGVVITFDNDIVYSRLARHCADPNDAVRHLDGLMAGRDVIAGRVTLPQVHRQLVDELGLALTSPEFEQAWLEPYSGPMPGMADLIGTLAETTASCCCPTSTGATGRSCVRCSPN